MKAKIIILFLALLFGYKAMAQQIETIGEFTFIRHEPIQMHATDSVTIYFPVYYFNGVGRRLKGSELDSVVIRSEKRATNSFHRWDINYYLTALEPTFPIWYERYWITERSNPSWNENWYDYCIRAYFVRQLSCVFFRAIIDGDTITINTPEKFRELFAPVTSVQQAIAFAHILTGAVPMFNLDFLATRNVDYLRQQRAEYEKRRIEHQRIMEERWQNPPYLFFERQDTIRTVLANGRTQINIVARQDSVRIPLPPPPPPFLTIDAWVIHQPEIISSNAVVTRYGFELMLYEISSCSTFSASYFRRIIKVTFCGRVEEQRGESRAAFSSLKWGLLD